MAGQLHSYLTGLQNKLIPKVIWWKPPLSKLTDL
jgi:hypothetical protein